MAKNAELGARLRFLGGAGTVTGSKHLLSVGKHNLLLDCGLFQGLKQLRLRNWSPPAFEVKEIEGVVVSHAHLDHSGYLPVLVRAGYRRPIFCTPATKDLLRVLLLDAAHLQEEDAERANRRRYSKHRPALPLFTTEDALAALKLLEPHRYGERFAAARGFETVFHRAGHIMGSAVVEVEVGERQPTRLVFSGDLGRWHRPILHDPELVSAADVLLIESTYGDRVHTDDQQSVEQLAQVIRDTEASKGTLLIPSFAVGRAQELIWTIRQLEEQRRIPTLPVYLDSPMAIDVTEIYAGHREEHDLDMQGLMSRARSPLTTHQFRLVHTAVESRELSPLDGPHIIIAGSGMATGGRILHHLKQRLPDERTIVLLPGFQAAGTRGRSLQDGAATVRMHGRDIPVRARVVTLEGLSAHADREEIFRWLAGFRKPPRATFVVHGEPRAASALAAEIETRLGWFARVATDGGVVSLDDPRAA